jgi:gas vesicle protein
MASESATRLEEQMREQYERTQETLKQSAHAWNELLIASAEMAYDAVLKNWDYSKSVRASAEQAMQDAAAAQTQLAKEMLQVWKGYAGAVQETVNKATK